MARGGQIRCPQCGAKTDVGRCRICGRLIPETGTATTPSPPAPDSHPAVDDPSTSTPAWTDPTPPPRPSTILPPLDFTPSRDPSGVLRDGERARASVVGGAPAGVDGARVAAAAAGGVIGALVLSAVRGKRAETDPGGRAMTLTSQRVLLFERGDLIGELPLDEVKRAKVKGSRASRKYQVLEVGANDGRKLLIEGFRNDIQTFVSALPKFGS